MRHAKILSLLSLVLCLSPSLFAQNATVSGHVVDPQQRGLKDSAVSLINLDTKGKIDTLTDDNGNFILPPVAPGHYEARASAAGFAPLLLTGITLELGQSKVLTLQLKVGSLTESISVTDTPPELNTDRADRSLMIERTFVDSIPLDIRNPLVLTNLTAGVTKGDDGLSGQNATSESRTNTFRINGGKGSTTDILIDGASNTTAYYNQAAGIPGVDSVQEFRVYTSAYAPEFGRTSGGIVSYALRSGSDQLHGSIFEYFRTSDLDANGFNANQAGLAKPAFSRNQFGGTVGGPLVLPKLYDGHGKTFFFFSYEGLRDSSAGSYTGTMPTDLERKGDFSQTRDSNGKLIVIYDPSTTIRDPSAPPGTTRYIRTPFKGNMIPNLNPIASKLLSLYPEPNQNGVGLSNTNNYFSNAPSTDDNNSYDARIDHRFNDRHAVFGHINYFSNNIRSSDYFGNGLAPVNANDRIPGINIGINHIWTIGQDLILEHHFSWAHSESNRAESVHKTPASLGFPDSVAPGITGTVTPQLSISRISGLGNNYPFEANKSSVYQYGADISWLKGIHTFKFGIDLRRYPVQLFDPQQMEVSASSSFTGGPNPTVPDVASGDGIAELLLGEGTVTSGYAPQTNSAHNYLAFYAQDIAKITPKLTVTYGLRYSYEGSDVERKDQLNYLDTTSPSPLAGKVLGFPNLIGGVGVPGLNGTSRSLQDTEKLHFDPRVGVAYALNNKTVIHSGFGLFHHPQAAWEQFPNALGTSRTSTSIDAQPDGVTPLYNLSNPFPQGLPQPVGTAAGLSISLGQNVAGDLRKQNIPYQVEWSFDIQRTLPQHFVVTAAYAGNEGVHLMSPIQLNQLPDVDLALGSKLLSVVQNPFYGIINDPSSTLSTPTIQYGQLLRPFPQFLNFKAINVGVGHSSYHAAQLTVERRISQGLAVVFAYTFSKSIDNVGEMTSVAGTRNGFQDNYCPRCDRSRSDLNQTHVVRLSTLYELPFGKGKPFSNQGLLSQIVGGWKIGGIYTLDSGQPLAVTSPNNSNSLGGGTGMRPNVTGLSDKLLGGPQMKLNGKYFNTAAFSRTPAYAFGNAPRYLSDIDLPKSWNFDALIEKNIPLSERYRMIFRMEMFNAPNSVAFAGPTTDVSSVSFGTIASLKQTNTPRELQFSLRFRY